MRHDHKYYNMIKGCPRLSVAHDYLLISSMIIRVASSVAIIK